MSDREAAEFLVELLKAKGTLDQETAVYEVIRRFGKEFSYINENGNSAIKKTVLTAFNKLTVEDVVWSRSERHWRFRQKRDLSGRMQP